MYDTAMIAYITEQTQRTVQRHIEKGYLNARTISGKYHSTQKELDSYLSNFLYSDEKNIVMYSRKKSIDAKEVEFLEKFLEETKQCKTIEDLILKFASLDLKIPTHEMFKRFQLHQNIIKDREKGFSYIELVEKHNVSTRTVYRVLKSAQELQS